MDAMTGVSMGAAAPQPLFIFLGRLGTMFRIHIENLILTIVTLGIYRFWAKTRMRKYLWNHVEVAGDPLEYTGTGKELFLGFALVFAVILLPVFILPAVVLPFIDVDIAWLHALVQAAQFVVIFLLLPVAIYRARRYRLSRTRWRGVRGALGGSAVTFATKYIMYGGLQVITFGLMTPTAHNRLAHYMYNNVQAGRTPLSFAAQTGPMYKKFWLAIAMFSAFTFAVIVAVAALSSSDYGLSPAKSPGMGGGGSVMDIVAAFMNFGIFGGFLLLFALTLPFAWYNASETIYFVHETALGGLKFSLDVGPWRLIAFNMINLIILLATLTLALPWIYKRTLDFYARRLTVAGDINALSIHQSPDQGPKQGEGLADAFDPAGF